MLNELKTLNHKNQNINHECDNNLFGKYDKFAVSKWINKMNQKNCKNINKQQHHSQNERISGSEVNIDQVYINKHSSPNSGYIINKEHSSRHSDEIINKNIPLSSSDNNNNNNKRNNPKQKQKSKVVPIIKYNIMSAPNNYIRNKIQSHRIPSQQVTPLIKQNSLNPQNTSNPTSIPQVTSKDSHNPQIQSNQVLYDKLTTNHTKNINTIHPFKEYFYSSEQNPEHRQTMEDFHNVVPQIGGDANKSYFAIFDGHGGNKASIFCKDKHHIILNKCLLATKNNIDKSLKYSFEQTDKELNAMLSISDKIGTTATVVVILYENDKRVIYCANVGDSKCYLLKMNGSVVQLSTDHTCANKSEVERIKKMEGLVFNNRVFGTLMITRSIGDKEMKNYGVIPTPTVKKVDVDEEEDNYIIIASDGLWDVIKEEQMLLFASEEMPADSLSKRLVKMAKEGGSIDNISCIVIKL